MNNILCCNAGRRGRLMIDMRKTIGDSGNVVATDNWSVAPAIFFANKQYVVPKITHPNYIHLYKSTEKVLEEPSMLIRRY